MSLSQHSDGELLALATTLLGSQRKITAQLVACLGEIEERRLHLVAGFSSLFEFCIKRLGMSEGEAFRRILAGRLATRFPVVPSLLASGALHLSALELLRDHLTEQNHGELFAAASGKSKREVEVLLAARFPRADVPATIRPARVQALSERRFKVEFTASQEFVEKLEFCRNLLSHANPERDIGAVLERALDLLVAKLQGKRTADAKHPPPLATKLRTNSVSSRRIGNGIRRQVFQRDGLRCSYVSPDGQRCEARAFLELDHAEPRGKGGADSVANLRVRCRAHNQLWAEQCYGREQVRRARHLRQQKCARGEEGRPSTHDGMNHSSISSQTGTPSSLDTLELVRGALRSMGFRDAQARQAVAIVQRTHAEIPQLKEALREALAVIT
ncbi:MAG TPA: HNH endonuclease signature motif containing protein [Polyangiaceae bacterium]